MVADILALLLVAGIGMRGYMRGLVAEVATLAIALLLWLSLDLWYPPADEWLGLQHALLAEFGVLRRIVAYSGAYAILLLIILALEALLVDRIALLKAGNRWLGATIGLARGMLYAVLLVWLIQVGAAGGRAVEEIEQQPDWMAESLVFHQLALWNPVRVMSARELLEESGASEWGKRSYAQLVRDPRVRSMLEQRGIKAPSLPNVPRSRSVKDLDPSEAP